MKYTLLLFYSYGEVLYEGYPSLSSARKRVRDISEDPKEVSVLEGVEIVLGSPEKIREESFYSPIETYGIGLVRKTL